MCSYHSVLECCVMFSGVKLSIRSFVLFHFSPTQASNSTLESFLEINCQPAKSKVI